MARSARPPFNGAAGDINPVGRDGADRTATPFEYLTGLGRQVGGVVPALDRSGGGRDPATKGPIRLETRDVRFPLKRTTAPEPLRGQVAVLEAELKALRDAAEDRGAQAVEYRLKHATETLAIATPWDGCRLATAIDVATDALTPIGRRCMKTVCSEICHAGPSSD